MNQSKTLILFSIMTAVYCSSMVIPVLAQNESGYVTFGKSLYGASIKHPADWEVKDSDRTTRGVGYDIIASICPKSMLEYPSEYSPDFSLCPNINEVLVATANLPKNATIEEYISYIQASQKFSYTNYKQENLSDFVIAGLPGKKLVYTYFGDYKHQGEFIKGLQVILLSGNKTYEIRYESPQLQFDDLLPTVEQMISSLKIFPMPPCNFVRQANDTISEGKCILKP